MAVTAYASLLSLTHVLDNLHYRAQFHLPHADMKQIEALQEHVHFLLEFVELRSESQSPKINAFWRKFTEVAFEVEDTIIFHVLHQLFMRNLGETSDAGFLAFCETMEGLIQKICSVKKEVFAIEEEGEDVRHGKLTGVSIPAAGLSIASSRGQDFVVGIDEHVIKIMDVLTSGKSNYLQIFPIVGMGGIGKTTLAKSVFDHQHIVNYFDMRFWLTISQEYSAKQILRSLLELGANKELISESLNDLGQKLYQKLFGRRYLIVMDDVWTIEIWNELKRFFPENENGSCIMLTTRHSDMATSLSLSNIYPLTFLDEDKSWDLFCQNAFGQITCPYEHLENLAKDIAKGCRGLPLEIVIIGRLLAKSNMTTKYWESVAKNISSFMNLTDDDHCLYILSLSYKSLPIHLKPCFLYMRVFPEDASIKVPNLIDYWIAEGFIKSINHKSLEENAREYLQGLIDRNLIFLRNIENSQEMCGIHDLLRDFCIRESDKELFIQSPKMQSIQTRFTTGTHCLLCKAIVDKKRIHIPKRVHILKSSSQSNPLFCDACKMAYSRNARPNLMRKHSLMTRMGYLHVGRWKDRQMGYLHGSHWKEILQRVEVRYASISFSYYWESVSPSKLHLLWNLLTIDLNNYEEILLPLEIWKMPQLRHVRFKSGFLLADPMSTHTDHGEDLVVLSNLQTLSRVINFKCSKEIVDRIPNLKKLIIDYEDAFRAGKKQLNHSVCNLEQLQKLESLEVTGALKNFTFPISLKQLSLFGCQMRWEDMSIIGSLPNLQILTLASGMEGREWNPVEGEFLQLKKLHIFDVDLVCWRADCVHFPILEQLELKYLDSLEEIPLGIGDIPTLKSIRLKACSDSTVDSAKKIWEEQHFMGNEIRIDVCNYSNLSYQVGAVMKE